MVCTVIKMLPDGPPAADFTEVYDVARPAGSSGIVPGVPSSVLNATNGVGDAFEVPEVSGLGPRSCAELDEEDGVQKSMPSLIMFTKSGGAVRIGGRKSRTKLPTESINLLNFL